MGVEAQAAHFESSQEKEWYYRWFEPDIVIGGGYENNYFATAIEDAAGGDQDQEKYHVRGPEFHGTIISETGDRRATLWQNYLMRG